MQLILKIQNKLYLSINFVLNDDDVLKLKNVNLSECLSSKIKTRMF